MTQEEKDLLIKDLSARLPYGVKCEYTSIQKGFEIHNEIGELSAIDKDVTGCEHIYAKIDGHLVGLSDFKPYLRSMSSMTEEEKEEMHNLLSPEGTAIYENDGVALPINHCGEFVPYEFMNRIIQYLLKNHFDFMGLIPKGLAIEVTRENNPYKE